LLLLLLYQTLVLKRLHLFAILGAAGLAVGLALQGSLANFGVGSSLY
jgi:small-conductance mechanosensitive channel